MYIIFVRDCTYKCIYSHVHCAPYTLYSWSLYHILIDSYTTVYHIQEKQRKKKRIKAIKSKNRLITKDLEVAAVQTNWKKFVTKVRFRLGIMRVMRGIMYICVCMYI